MKFRSLSMILILVVSAASAYSQTGSKDEATLRTLVKRMLDAQVAYDPTELDKVFSADYIEISPVGEFDPREKVMSFYGPEAKQAAAGISTTAEATDFSIRQYDKFAVVITAVKYGIAREGTPLPPRSIRATIVCRKDKGEWKIMSAQYTGIRPSPSK